MEKAYEESLDVMAQLVDDGQTHEAFTAYQTLVSDYPEVESRQPMRDSLMAISNREADLVNSISVELNPGPGEIESSREAEAIGREIAAALHLEGLLVVELFLCHAGQWVVNEMAPRPHNSGHFSIDGSVTSQFENHIRAVCNLPLGETRGHSFSAMQNLLGETLVEKGDCLASEVLALGGTHLHLYDKGEPRAGRKMGHVNLTDDDPAKLRERVDALRKILHLPEVPTTKY